MLRNHASIIDQRRLGARVACLTGMFALLPIPALGALPRIDTSTSAHYQNLSGGTDADFFQFPSPIPVTVTSQSTAAVSGFAGYGRSGHPTLPDIECAWDDADAFATATMPGLDGLYARSGGYSPQSGPPDDVVANAAVTIRTNWVAVGPTPTTFVDLLAFFDGFLYVSKNSGLPTLLEASVDIEIDVISSLGTTRIFDTSSLLNFATGFSSSFTTSNGASPASWNGSWANNSATLTSTNGVDRLFELDYLENINDIVVVPTGQIFDVVYSIRVRSFNGEGPSELFATADFSNTADISLTSNDPNVTVTEVNVLPEPTTTVGVAVGFLSLMWRSRRRAGCS